MIYFGANAALASTAAFLPTIIKTFGYSEFYPLLCSVWSLMVRRSQRACPAAHRTTLCCHISYHHNLFVVIRPPPLPRAFHRDLKRGGCNRISVSSFRNMRPTFTLDADPRLRRDDINYIGCYSPSRTIITCGTSRPSVLLAARTRQSASSLPGVSAPCVARSRSLSSD